MPSRAFIDTNVFVYAFDNADPQKQQRAQQVLREEPGAVVSTQVLNEFYVTTTRKLAAPLSPEDAERAVEHLSRRPCVAVDSTLVLRAISDGRRWQLSHWDALMLAAARQAGCDRILTEDLADGASYPGIRIENPFRDA